MTSDMCFGEDKDLLLDKLAESWSFFNNRFLRSPEFCSEPLLKLIFIDERKLVEAVEHALIDLDRMCRHHLPSDDENPDRHKFAGFLSRWVAKIRPIYIADGYDHEVPDTLYRLNAHYAFVVFRQFLRYPVPGEIQRNLVYAFHYRDWRGEALALLAYTSERAYLADQKNI